MSNPSMTHQFPKKSMKLEKHFKFNSRVQTWLNRVTVQCNLFFYRKFGQYRENKVGLVEAFFDLHHRSTFRRIQIRRNYQPGNHFYVKACLDQFQFRWLRHSTIDIGNAVSNPLMFNHLSKMKFVSGLLTPMSLHHVKKFAALSLAKNVPTFARVVNFGGSSWFEIISHSRVATLQATIPVCKIVKISSGANFSGARSISNHSAISS